MKRFLMLVNFEWNRFLKLYLILVGGIIGFQLIGTVVKAVLYNREVSELFYDNRLTTAEVIEQMGNMSLYHVISSPWFYGPIMLSVAALLIYAIFIWYRDWLGKNTFIYRLLMLPTQRLNVYLAKATTIVLSVWGLIALQLVLIPIENQLLKWQIPKEYFFNLSIKDATLTNNLIAFYPNTFMEFILIYGMGTIAVFILFTAILFERSFRLKGIFYGALYVIASVTFALLPLLVDSFILGGYFYPLEMFLLELVMTIIVAVGAVWLAHYLLNNKIRV